MYWFFNCNNYRAQAIKALVYSAHIYNPDFKPICIWDEPEYSDSNLKEWLEEKGVLVYPYRSELAENIFNLSKENEFLYLENCDAIWSNINLTSLSGMWSKADVPKICENLGISDEYVLVTDPDCIFVSKFELEYEPEILAAGPEEEPYRDWISGGIYIFNTKRCLIDRNDFHKYVIKNYQKIGYAENIAYMDYYGYENITHISPDWNYKPYWEKKEDYLISPINKAVFRSTPKLIHFQGIYKPWIDPPKKDNTDMQYYCDLWDNFVKLSENNFKFNR